MTQTSAEEITEISIEEESTELSDLRLKSEESEENDDKASTKPKAKIRLTRSAKVGARYPSQYMKIGEIHCIFLSCFDHGQSPILTLGPSWPFTIFLLFLAAMILCYFVMMISMGQKAHVLHKGWCYLGVAANWSILLGGILKNPGIP